MFIFLEIENEEQNSDDEDDTEDDEQEEFDGDQEEIVDVFLCFTKVCVNHVALFPMYRSVMLT